ncbi:MAG: prepilin-type N-terminal cleavage/methylation domain-containing protein [Deltaproteobacteria bacterium]|nr:prepilin-type N-terminal cleavage/methylation domain-containing protein [Deltaproteobacteria bacterium]
MPRDTKGYTLIELIVVIVLLGMIFTLTAPKFRDAILTDNLKSTTRKLVGKIKALRNKTIQNHEAQILRFDLESNMYWVESADMSCLLSQRHPYCRHLDQGHGEKNDGGDCHPVY